MLMFIHPFILSVYDYLFKVGNYFTILEHKVPSCSLLIFTKYFVQFNNIRAYLRRQVWPQRKQHFDLQNCLK